MAPARGTLGRAWRAVEGFAGSRRAGTAVFVLGLAVYGAVSLALPLGAGRDLPRYLLAYAQLFDAHVTFPQVILARAPVSPFVAGVVLEAGPVAAEVVFGLLYASSILGWWAVARRFGGGAAAVTALALLAYPGYVLLFHEVASDALFAAGFSLFAVVLARALERPSAGRAAALGASVALLVLVRPGAQALLLAVAVPLLAARGWRPRIRATAAFVAAVALPLSAWVVHNGVRLDDFTIARGAGTTLPLFRAFVADRIVEPDNGPASRELARVVARDLLPYEPYRSYGVDLEEFFSSGSSRMHDDLTVLADRTWGWDDDYAHLARVGREAVLAHPRDYAEGVASDLGRLLTWPLYAPVSSTPPAASADDPTPPSSPGGAELPPPGEGQPIPSAREAPYITTPEGRIREVWTSATEHAFVFADPADAARNADLDVHVNELLAALPDREQRPDLVRLLNDLSRLYPRPFMWLLVGLVAVAVRRPRGFGAALALAGAALLILLSTSLAVYAVAEYAVPFVPAFVLLATVGLLGRRPA